MCTSQVPAQPRMHACALTWGLHARAQMRQREQRAEEMARATALPFAAEAPDLDASLREQARA